MKNIKRSFVVLLLLLTVLWLLADTLVPEPFTYFSFRNVFVQLTGIISIGAMSVAMVLALRPKWLEPRLNGLDKMYRLHKWLGVTALVTGILHWWWAKGTKWMVGWGWLGRPTRRPNPGEELGAIEGWLRGQRGFAETLGEWAFYAAFVLIVLALVRRFPYHLFVKTHKWLAALYLVLVFHSIVLTKIEYWSQPIGWLLALLMASGTVAAVLVLAKRVGADRKVRGTVGAIHDYPELRVLEVAIDVKEGWYGHEAGQFGFVTSGQGEGSHPFTFASAWDPKERRIAFLVKALGDFTGRLREQLQVGAPVTLEGPYGCFTFRDERPRQIWVGGGIGITPFVARMTALAQAPGNQEIDLFHTTKEFDEKAIARLTEDARAANVRLHVLVDDRDGLLTGERVRALVPDWRSASIWFCGPPGFGAELRRDFVANGLPKENFHQELFQLR